MLRDKWKENRSIGRRETSNGQGVEELKRRGISGVHQKKDEDETIGDKKDRKLAKGDSEIADKKGRWRVSEKTRFEEFKGDRDKRVDRINRRKHRLPETIKV